MFTSIALYMVKELSLWVIVGAGIAMLWIIPLIDFLYKMQFTVQHVAMQSKVNEEWMKIHGKDTGTPKLGGILIWLTVPFIFFTFFWQVSFLKAMGFIILIVGFYGFLDDYLTIVIKKFPKFREFQEGFEWRLGKFIVSILVNAAVALLIVYMAEIKEVSLFTWAFRLDNIFGIAAISFIASVFSYSTEIIDGIDALATGLYIGTLVGFAFLMLALPAAFITSAGSSAIVAVGVLLGVLFVYLYFNIPPARVYMGGPGAMPMGPVFLMFALKGNLLIALVFMMLPYLLDLASSFIQILSIRFFKRKVFKIAPVHHHFEAIGWPGPKVVMRFWLFNYAMIFLAIFIQLSLMI
jgi:phospho-N-acetylmuramoyl-pentapeptide-transferase